MISDGQAGRTAQRSGFDEFYMAKMPGAMRLAHLVTGSVAIGQEVAQDAFLSLHSRWDDVENPAAYLRSAVVNLSRSVQRRQIRERRHARREIETIVATPPYDETWLRLKQLPLDQRIVVVLRYYADMSLNEIASELDKPLGTIKSTLHRALTRLKETLNDRP